MERKKKRKKKTKGSKMMHFFFFFFFFLVFKGKEKKNQFGFDYANYLHGWKVLKSGQNAMARKVRGRA